MQGTLYLYTRVFSPHFITTLPYRASLLARGVMENMNVFDYDGMVPTGDWEIARLYAVLVFEKKSGTQDTSAPPSSYDKYRFFIPHTPERIQTAENPSEDTINGSHGDFSSKDDEGVIFPGGVFPSGDFPSRPMEVVPVSPDFPPPQPTDQENDNDDYEEDPALLRMLATRAKAVELAGGEEKWESLSEEEVSRLMAIADGPTTPDFPPPMDDLIIPTSPEDPPPDDEEEEAIVPTSPDYDPADV